MFPYSGRTLYYVPEDSDLSQRISSPSQPLSNFQSDPAVYIPQAMV